WDVSEDHDRDAVGEAREVGAQPGELIVSQDPEALAGTLARDVDEADEMHSVVVEAVPALAFGARAETLQVFRLVADDVVFAGDAEDLADLGFLEDLRDGVELPGGREVGQVAGMDQ